MRAPLPRVLASSGPSHFPSEAMRLTRIGSTVDEDSLGIQVHRTMASHLCRHQMRPCPDCMNTVRSFLKPVIRFAIRAAMGNRPEGPIGKMDGHAALGAALEHFMSELNNA